MNPGMSDRLRPLVEAAQNFIETRTNIIKAKLAIFHQVFRYSIRAAIVVPVLLFAVTPSALAKTEILWDTWGVPHVFADDNEGMFYGFGWALATLHGDMMVRNYGTARGRAAEYWGADMVESDRQVHTLRIPERAGLWAGMQTPEMQRAFKAFVAGINDYAMGHLDQIDDTLEQVLPITYEDVFAHQQRSGTLPFAYWLVARDVKAWQERGSNTWVIGPTRSASGNPILLLNGHVPWIDNLFRQTEVHLVSPEVMTYGTTVGAPVVPGGFTDHHALGGTVNTLDNVDLFELTLGDGGYLWDGEIRAFETRSHTIKVRETDGSFHSETFESRWSVHGPVLEEKEGKAIAVRLADLDQPFQYEQYWQMARAKSFGEFERAVKRLQSSKANMTYADRDGHIYYFTGARIPRRSEGDVAYWAGIVPGDTARTLWTDFLSYEELPHFVDPASGWIQNANDPPWYSSQPQELKAEDFPAWMSPVGMRFRPQRSTRMITSAKKFSLEQVEALKLSTRVELADRILDDLIPAARAHSSALVQQAADVLEAWDRMTEAQSRGAVLFEAWVRAMDKEYAPAGKSMLASYAPAAESMFATAWDPARPIDTPDGLAEPVRAATLLEKAAAQVRETWGGLDVAWGDVHRFRCADNDWPANGGPGDLGIFRTIGYRPAADGKLVGMTGDSFVAIIEMGEKVRARVLMSYGNSSQPKLPFKCDQMELLARKEMRWALITRDEIEAHLLRREEF